MTNHVDPRELQKFILEVPLDELVRTKEINLLISHRESQLVLQWIKTIRDLVLWDGPLGKVVRGTHPELFEEMTVSAHMSKTHFARSMRAAAVKYEELTSKVPEQLPQCSQGTAQFQETSTLAVSRDFLDSWR